MESIERIGIVGTGNVGSALATRLVASGLDVVLGQRAGTDGPTDLAARLGARAHIAALAKLPSACDAIVLAVPGSAAKEAAASLGALDGTLLIARSMLGRYGMPPCSKTWP
jgi:hypothetical protein